MRGPFQSRCAGRSTGPAVVRAVSTSRAAWLLLHGKEATMALQGGELGVVEWR